MNRSSRMGMPLNDWEVVSDIPFFHVLDTALFASLMTVIKLFEIRDTVLRRLDDCN